MAQLGDLLGNAPTRHPTSIEIAWAAGLFEGEGHPYLNSGSTGVRLGQNDTWVLDRLTELFGGSIKADKPDLRYKSGQNGIRYHAWTLTGARSRGFLLTIYSLLSPRRKQQIDKVLKDNRAKRPGAPRKTHCKWGHALIGDNVTMAVAGEQVCRTCSRDKTRRYRVRQQAQS